MLMANENDKGVSFEVLVVPRAGQERIGPVIGDRLKVQVTSPPADQEANLAVIACLARACGVAKSAVKIIRGARSRRKTIRIDGIRKSVVEQLGSNLAQPKSG